MLRKGFVVGLTGLIAMPAAPTLVVAQPRDQAPSVADCAALGFSRPNPQAEQVVATPARRGGAAAPRLQPRPPISAPAEVTPPPPLPIPPVAVRVETPAPPLVLGAPPPPIPYAPSQPRDTETYLNVAANGIKRTTEEPVSTFSIDVDTAAYANVRRFLNDNARVPADAVRVEELLNYFDYDYRPPVSRDKPFEPFVAVAPSPWSQGRQIVHIGLQGYRLPQAQQPPLNLVFLIDTSGSMMGEDRLPLAKKAMNILIDQLGSQDRVAMVAYAGSAGAVLAPTTGDQKLKIRCAMDFLNAGGSTAGGQGLELAYALAKQNFRRDAVNRIVLLTDGDFNVGVSSPQRMKDLVAEQRKSGVYLSVYGFGRGNYQDVMMQSLAQNGNGTAAYVDTLSEARKLFRDDFAGSLFPIADDVKIQVEFNPARVSEYRLIGYETRMLAREDFNNDQVDAGEVGSGASVTALYEITPAGGPLSSDPLRYGPNRPPPGGGRELAYLKIRFKPPGGQTSELIERPIGDRDLYTNLAAAPEATRFAVAVAAFGQKLKGDPRVSDDFGWSAIRDLAQGARGDDPYGLRAEFVQLTRAAETRR